MARRDVVRLGLFPELSYYQPPNLIEDEKEKILRRSSYRPSNSRSSFDSARQRIGDPSSISLSSRATSPSAFSSRDAKDEVLAVLKRRFPIGGRKTESKLKNDDDESSTSTGAILQSRKRTLIDQEGTTEEDWEKGPRPKNARIEVAVGGGEGIEEEMDTGTSPIAQVVENGSKSRLPINNGASKIEKRAFGLLDVDEFDSEEGEKVEDLFAGTTEEEKPNRARRCRLRPIYGRRRGNRNRLEESTEALPKRDRDDEEESEEAVAAFRAGQEYDRRRVTAWMKSSAILLEPRPDFGSITNSGSTTFGTVLPTVAVTPPKISSAPSLAYFRATTSDEAPPRTDAVQFSSFSVPSTTPAPVTTVTWSTSLTTPILAVQPLSIAGHMNNAITEVSSIDTGPTAAPAKMNLAPTTSSSSNDVAVDVTLPLPLAFVSSENPSTSLTFRLPAPTATNLVTAAGGDTTSGFSFTFTGQPVNTGQFNFASLDPSTNIFSAVGSIQNAPRRKPGAASASYLSRRRNR